MVQEYNLFSYVYTLRTIKSKLLNPVILKCLTSNKHDSISGDHSHIMPPPAVPPRPSPKDAQVGNRIKIHMSLVT